MIIKSPSQPLILSELDSLSSIDQTSTKFPRHPEYLWKSRYYRKWRFTLEGGRRFIWAYLKRFSKHEPWGDFYARREMTYIPSVAKSAIVEIRNALLTRLHEIQREGPDDYLYAMDNCVDTYGTPMNQFLGTTVLEELLALGKVAIWVDSTKLLPVGDKARPYLYLYKVEEILNWDDEHDPSVILLRELVPVYDDNGLLLPSKKGYRLAKVKDGKVEVTITDENDSNKTVETINIPKLPIVILSMPSLLMDIAEHQIALMNLSSSDLNFVLRSNFPFYTEQYDVAADMLFKQQAKQPQPVSQGNVDTASGTSVESLYMNIDNSNETPVTPVGVSVGRRYPKGVERPGWIAPPTEPLLASMEKQSQIEKEVRRLVNLALTNLSPTRSSSESKSEDQRGMEAGLAFIAGVLLKADRKIAEIWTMYTKDKEPIVISYPTEFSLKSDDDRYKEADSLLDLIPKTPSITIKRLLLREAVVKVFGTRITSKQREEIFEEIDAMSAFETNAKTILSLVEGHLLSNKTASTVLGFEPEEAELAAVDHTDKLSRIAIAQSEAPLNTPGTDTGLSEKEKTKINNSEDV